MGGTGTFFYIHVHGGRVLEMPYVCFFSIKAERGNKKAIFDSENRNVLRTAKVPRSGRRSLIRCNPVLQYLIDREWWVGARQL